MFLCKFCGNLSKKRIAKNKMRIILSRGKLWEIKRRTRRPVKVKTTARRIANNKTFESNFDTQGSYTGVDAFDKYEKPVQDADDL